MDTRRRRFIVGSTTFAAAPLAWANPLAGATAPADEPQTGPSLVALSIVALGGLDPFLAVKPAAGRAFARLRPRLAECLPSSLSAYGVTMNPALARVFRCWREGRAALQVVPTDDVARSGHADACLRLRETLRGQGSTPVRPWEPGLHVRTRTGWTRLAWNAGGLPDPRRPCDSAMADCLASLLRTRQPLQFVATVPGFDWHLDAPTVQAAGYRMIDRLVAAADDACSRLELPCDIDVRSELGRAVRENAMQGSDHGCHALRIRVGAIGEAAHAESIEALRAVLEEPLADRDRPLAVTAAA